MIVTTDGSAFCVADSTTVIEPLEVWVVWVTPDRIEVDTGSGLLVALDMVVAVLLARTADVLLLSPTTGAYALESEALYLVAALSVVLLGAGRFSLGGSAERHTTEDGARLQLHDGEVTHLTTSISIGVIGAAANRRPK